MKFYPLDHRSEAWFAKRRGIPTASQFGRIITAAGRPSSQAPLYESELIAERIFGRPFGRDISGIPAVRHGVETEPDAAEVLESILGIELQPGGFMTDDDGRYGASPDRIIVRGNSREVVEIKCPYEIPQHIKNLLCGPDDNHKAQVQGQLLISGYDAAHFFSYHPQCPPKYERIERDDKFIRALAQQLRDFCARLEDDHQRALAMGAWGV